MHLLFCTIVNHPCPMHGSWHIKVHAATLHVWQSALALSSWEIRRLSAKCSGFLTHCICAPSLCKLLLLLPRGNRLTWSHNCLTPSVSTAWCGMGMTHPQQDFVQASLQGAQPDQQHVLALGRQLSGEDLVTKALHIVLDHHLEHSQLLVHFLLLRICRVQLLACQAQADTSIALPSPPTFQVYFKSSKWTNTLSQQPLQGGCMPEHWLRQSAFSV